MASNQKSFKYHVFLSFRGEDTRKTFVGHLYKALKRQGIHTFKDNEELEKGKRIDELFKAIEESKFFIILFSKNYASSSWCLKEVTKIMECQKTNEQNVYPLFYDVNPADVRKQSGEVGGAFAKHNGAHVGKWKKALEDAGNLVGWDLRNREEAEAIDEIVKEISVKLSSTHLNDDKYLTGMEPRMQDPESFLGIGVNDDVRMIGIKGMGGIGKTTLARAIFDKMSFRFDGISFVEDVRKVSKEKGLLKLQQQVLSDVLSISLQEIRDAVKSVHSGKHMMKTRLPCKKVLLVLDDVDREEQLEALAGALDWFKNGSRIIITTRDEKVLARRVNKIHEVEFLSDEEAICLFSKYAFERDTPIQGFEEFSCQVIRYAAGLPLTIKVLGSHLHGEKMDIWIDVIKRLETIPWKETLEVLEISYNGLEDDHKEIFLDVACIMKGLRIDVAIAILESCGFHALAGLRVLEQKSLVNISNQRLGMHDSIEELGRDIVRRSQPREPNKRSRLWIPEEIVELLSNDMGTEASSIRLELVELSPNIVMKGFGSMKKLRCLIVESETNDNDFYFDWKFDQVRQYLPNALQFLRWVHYPAPFLPLIFGANNLVSLEMPDSRITQLWEAREGQVLNNLRFIDLSRSMLVTLDLELTPRLEWLELKECHDLVDLRTPDGSLTRLVHLDLIGCSSFNSFSFIKRLESLPLLSLPKLQLIAKFLQDFSRITNLPWLEFKCLYSEEQPSSKSVSLNLMCSAKLECVSGSICGLQHLRHLTFNGCITELPNDLDQLQCLEELILLSTDIKCLPDSICTLNQLKSLKLESCLLLKELPKDLGQLECLEKLILLSPSIKHLPDSICMLKHLKSLKLKSYAVNRLPENLGDLQLLEKLNLSARIKHLPDSICRLESLKYLKLKSCWPLESLPENLGKLKSLEKLNLIYCESLREIPNSICNMKNLERFYLRCCYKVKELPEQLGDLQCLKELNIIGTGISRIPLSTFLVQGLCIFGSVTVLKSYTVAPEVQTAEGNTSMILKIAHAPT